MKKMKKNKEMNIGTKNKRIELARRKIEIVH